MNCCECNTINDNELNTSLQPLYTKKDTFICLFCGGESCKHENYLNHPNPAIEGLHSDQIDEFIFASQRPSNVLIEKFDLISTFKNKNIGMIVNLQRPGEHPYCGPNKGLDVLSGFTYSPSIFVSNGIDVLLVGWKDLNCPESLSFVLDIVKKMNYVIKIKKQKVLVHCHAGYGRTGIVIVCYKIFNENVTDEIALKDVRAKRSKCVQNSDQQKYCNLFYLYLNRLKKIFGNNIKDIHVYLEYQNYLYNYNGNVLINIIKSDLISNLNEYIQYVPLLLIKIFDRLIYIKESYSDFDINDFYDAFISNVTFNSIEIEDNLIPIINSINYGNWNIIDNYNDIYLLTGLIYYWIEKHVSFIISERNICKIYSNISFSKDNDINNKYMIITDCLYTYELMILKFLIKFMNNLFLNDNEKKEKIYLLFSKYFLKCNNNESTGNNTKIITKLYDIILIMNNYFNSKNENNNNSTINKSNKDNTINEEEYFNERGMNSILTKMVNLKESSTTRTNNNDKELKKIKTIKNMSMKPWIVEEDC